MEHTRHSHLTDREFLRVVDHGRDPLTTTNHEIELERRLEFLVSEIEQVQPLLDVLADQGIYNAAQLETFFENFDAMKLLVDDAADTLDRASDAGDDCQAVRTRINTLLDLINNPTTTTQE